MAEFLETEIENSALHGQISTSFLPVQDFDQSALTHDWSPGWPVSSSFTHNITYLDYTE